MIEVVTLEDFNGHNYRARLSVSEDRGYAARYVRIVLSCEVYPFNDGSIVEKVSVDVSPYEAIEIARAIEATAQVALLKEKR